MSSSSNESNIFDQSQTEIAQNANDVRENITAESTSSIVFSSNFLGRYKTLVIDPPWPIRKQFWGEGARHVPPEMGLEYRTMTIERIAAMPIPSLYHAKGCNVFTWIVDKYEEEAKDMMRGWGIRSFNRLTWHKSSGMIKRNFLYNNCEYVLWGQVGKPERLSTKGLKACFYGKRAAGHSRKPTEFYQMISHCFQGPRLDMFSREKHLGFEQWGDQTDFRDANNYIIPIGLPLLLWRTGQFTCTEIRDMARVSAASERYFNTPEKKLAYNLCLSRLERMSQYYAHQSS